MTPRSGARERGDRPGVACTADTWSLPDPTSDLSLHLGHTGLLAVTQTHRGHSCHGAFALAVPRLECFPLV